MPEGRTFDPYSVLLKLPHEVQRSVLTILTRQDPMSPGVVKQLTQALKPFEVPLEQFGLLLDYYAWALIYWASQQDQNALKAALRDISGPSARDQFGDHTFN